MVGFCSVSFWCFGYVVMFECLMCFVVLGFQVVVWVCVLGFVKFLLLIVLLVCRRMVACWGWSCWCFGMGFPVFLGVFSGFEFVGLCRAVSCHFWGWFGLDGCFAGRSRAVVVVVGLWSMLRFLFAVGDFLGWVFLVGIWIDSLWLCVWFWC